MKLLRLALAALLVFPAFVHALDTDGDGFSDEIETLAGSSPTSGSSTPNGGQPIVPQSITTFTNVGVELNFAAAGTDKISAEFSVLGVSLATLAPTQVFISIGGVAFQLPLLDKKSFTSPTLKLELSEAPILGVVYNLKINSGNFASLLLDEGLSNATITNQLRSIDVEVFVSSPDGNKLYKATNTNTYNATAGVKGNFHELLPGTGDSFGNSKTIKPAISSILAVPNPTLPGVPVKFVASASIKGDNITATIDFGDGSALITLTGDAALAAAKSGIVRTYAANCVYEATLTLTSSLQTERASIFVIVGRNTQVNPVSGMSSTATVTTGKVDLAISTANVPGATTVRTDFSDTLGREVIDGFFPSRNAVNSGIIIATSVATDAGNVEVSRVRKTIVVSSRNAQESAPNDDPASTEAAVKKLTGGFTFDGSKTDKIGFQAEVGLPATFMPAVKGATDEGIQIAVAVGNVTDSIRVDAKGKPLGASAKGILKKFKISFPKTNDKPAKLSGSIELADASAAGFDTEGITGTLRETEKNLGAKGVSRSIQLGIVIDGIAYDSLAPVLFKVGKDAETGKFVTRSNVAK